MADGDLNAVFRARFDPALHRRRVSAPIAAPPVVTAYSFRRRPRPWELIAGPRLHPAFSQHNARRALFQLSVFTDALITQGGVTSLAPISIFVRITQGGVTEFGAVNPVMELTQGGFMAVGEGPPCTSTWAQLWRITRKDGRVFRFTSLDVDVTWGVDSYKACGSLSPSATQDNSAIGQVSNQELVGIFDDDGITEADIYAGLFNDAFTEVWLFDLDKIEAPRRLAAGWTGNLKHEVDKFNMEVIGPGARLDQQSMVQLYSPECRWIFGSTECGVDREALKITGEITSASSRGFMIGDISGSSGSDGSADGLGLQWEDGLMRFLSGKNVGLSCEVKTATFGTLGSVVLQLWDPAGFLPEPGDLFDLLPGCDLSFATCKDVYNNGVRHGGFPDVPGEDSVTATPDAKLS